MEKLSGERVFKLLKIRGFILSMEEVQFITDFLNCFVELHGKLDEKNLLTKPVLDFNEAARYLRMSPSHLYKLTSSKQVPHYCPQGKKLYFNREELDKWLLRNRQMTKAEIDAAAIDYIVRNRRKR